MYGYGFPFASTLCEKSPRRSSSVGTVTRCSPTGSFRRWNSWLKKKNALFRCVLKVFGMKIGPPTV